jgi:chemosensory pili system protein ChpA (sensor histidine kinase/response regulator)
VTELTSKRILVVDDHVTVRRMLCSLLVQQGFEVWDAADGSAGITKALEISPDLIILDFAMPVMNGLEAAQALQLQMPLVPLLMFTNTVGVAMEQEARAVGIAALVSKSATPTTLIAQVNALLH